MSEVPNANNSSRNDKFKKKKTLVLNQNVRSNSIHYECALTITALHVNDRGVHMYYRPM
jgi:hypothetical protein